MKCKVTEYGMAVAGSRKAKSHKEKRSCKRKAYTLIHRDDRGRKISSEIVFIDEALYFKTA